MDYNSLLKSHRKKALIEAGLVKETVLIGRDQIKKIIPQREPVLFLDNITGIDFSEELVVGTRYMNPDDPVFKGHFPGFPVYPGSYTVEMIGQLGLCLYYFLENKQKTITDQAEPLSLRATRILGAYFLEPILPGHTVTLMAKKLEYNGFTALAIGQALVAGKVCCVSIGEVCFL